MACHRHGAGGLRGRAGRGDRASDARHRRRRTRWKRSSGTPASTTSRHATCSSGWAVGSREEPRHVLPDRPLDRDARTRSRTRGAPHPVPGQRRGRSRMRSTADMVHGVAELIAFCSRFMTLEPGRRHRHRDAGGVGAFREPPRFLGDGDVVVVDDRGHRARCRIAAGSIGGRRARAAPRSTSPWPTGRAGLTSSSRRDDHRRSPAAPGRRARTHWRRCGPRSTGPVAGPPLRDLARPGQRVAISVCDITRPQPRPLMLAAIMEVLDGIVRPEDVVVLIATGTHRRRAPSERSRCSATEVLAPVAGRRSRRARPSEPRRPRHGRGRAGLPRPRVGRGGPPDHDRFRGAALLRRVQRRTEDGRAGPGGARRRRSSCTTPGGSATRGRPGASSRATRSTTPSGRSRRRRASTSRSTCSSTTSSGSPGPSPARSSPMHAAACAAARARGDAAGRRAVRHRGHDEQRLPARPEPVPGGQGHVRGSRDRRARAARSSARPSAGTGCPTTGRTGRCSMRLGHPADLLERIAASPVTIPDQWQVQIQARVQAQGEGRSCARRPHRRRGPGCAPRADPRHRRRRSNACWRADPDARICVLPQGPADDRLRRLTLRRDGRLRTVHQALASARRSSQRRRSGSPTAAAARRTTQPSIKHGASGRPGRGDAGRAAEGRPGGAPGVRMVVTDDPAPPRDVRSGSPSVGVLEVEEGGDRPVDARGRR